MRESLLRHCEAFIHNRDEIKSYFKRENQYLVAVCASEFCDKNVLVGVERLLECKNILDQTVGVFSKFRGNAYLPIICMLAADENPQARMAKAKEIHDALKLRFRDSQYVAMLATKLCEMIDEDQADGCGARAKDIYTLMKKEHPFLTGMEDSIFATLLAFSFKKDEDLIEDIETCFKILKKFSNDNNAMQSLSHVLALTNGDPEKECERVISIYKALEVRGYRYGKGYEMAVLGALSILQTDISAIIEDIMEVDGFLAQQKGYGGLGIDKKTRLMHAAMLVANDYSDENIVNTVAVTGALVTMAAQQAAMCSIIAATVATTSTI